MPIGTRKQSKRKWTPLNLADEVTNLISETSVGDEWQFLYKERDDGTGYTRERVPEIDNPSIVDRTQAARLSDLASRLVNNRIVDPIRAVAYGSKTEQDFGVSGPNGKRFDPKVIENILDGSSYSGFLWSRFWATTLMVLLGMGAFYGSAILLSGYGSTGGLFALFTSFALVLALLGWRIIRGRMQGIDGYFIRNYDTLGAINMLSSAMDWLDTELERFMVNVAIYQNECIPQTDVVRRDFTENSFWLARSMATWAIARRAAQYIAFQPSNVQEKYEKNGVSIFQTRLADSSFRVTQTILIVGMIIIALESPTLLAKYAPGSEVALGSITISGMDFVLWPIASSAFLAAIIMWIGRLDRDTYKLERNRVTLALNDFWRRGTTRTAEEIADLDVPQSQNYEAWFDNAGYQMLAGELKEDDPNPRESLKKAFEEWKAARLWAQALESTDPTARLMRRHISLLKTLESRQSVRNFADTPSPQRKMMQRLSAASSRSSTKSRTRALASLARREIWHP